MIAQSLHNTVSMYTQKTVRIRNIISFCKTIQHSITASMDQTLAASTPGRPGELPHNEIHSAIHKQARRIASILNRKNAHAGHLPIRSQRAYQWLMFLSQRENYLQHLAAVRILYQVASRIKKPPPLSRLPARITLFNIGPLYRIKSDRDTFKVTLHESFLIAPADVLFSVLAFAFDKDNKEARATIRSFSASSSCAEIREELAYQGIPPLAGVEGNHKNLHHAFRRVNKRYFQGVLSRPHLVWSKRLTHRKFGHYQYETDTVLISRSLDDPHISDSLLDFVIFHELLHKDMGYKEINGRRYSHTPAFRERERTFHNYQEVTKALKNLSRTLS